jgi:hypothetical protein
MVTIIPLCRGECGLHVYDWTLEKWMDVEQDAPHYLQDEAHDADRPEKKSPMYAVVLGGESLARATNGFIPLGMHEVANLRSTRYSMPFQSLARRDAVFDSAKLDQQRVGEVMQCAVGNVNAGEFVEAMSAARTSSNFPRNDTLKAKSGARRIRTRAATESRVF